MKALVLFLLLIANAYAEKKPQVLLIDEDIDGKVLERDFDVRRGSTHKSSIPDRQKREELLKGVKETQKWDELAKDIFYVDLEKRDMNELKRRYPSVPEATLRALKEKRSK
jgi:hypothetical protein